MLEIKSLNYLSIHLERLIKGRLWLKVIIGLILGAGLGVLLNPSTGWISEKLSSESSQLARFTWSNIYEARANDYDTLNICLHNFGNCRELLRKP
jgi:hypothetical protein